MRFLRFSPLEFVFVALFAAPVVSAPAGLTPPDIKARPASPQAMNFSLEGKITNQAAGKLTVSLPNICIRGVAFNAEQLVVIFERDRHLELSESSNRFYRIFQNKQLESNLQYTEHKI